MEESACVSEAWKAMSASVISGMGELVRLSVVK